MNTTSMSADREAFEKWAASGQWDVSRFIFADEHYEKTETYFAWQAWQAAQAATSAPANRGPMSTEQLKSVADAYAYLWCVNTEPGTPHQYPPERAAHEARKLLRDMLTKEERIEAVNRVLQIRIDDTPGVES